MKYVVLLGIFALSTVAANAGSADPSKVQATLRAQGFTHWKSLVLDNGTWEVDDAINTAGKQFDLRIDDASQKITSQIAE